MPQFYIFIKTYEQIWISKFFWKIEKNNGDVIFSVLVSEIFTVSVSVLVSDLSVSTTALLGAHLNS